MVNHLKGAARGAAIAASGYCRKVSDFSGFFGYSLVNFLHKLA
jgi:hypothetical protein